MTVRYLCGPTTDLLTDLADRWSLNPGPNHAGPRHLATVDLAIPDSQRRTATFLLYEHLLMSTEIARMLREGNLDAALQPRRRLPGSLHSQPRWLHLGRKRRRTQLSQLHTQCDA